jgi:hypothetical protein
MSRACLVVPFVLAALAAGCGGSASSAGDFEGEERQVADVVEKLQSAGETGDAAEICAEVLSRDLRAEMEAADLDCEQELDKAIKDADDFELEVEDVTISGNTATAEVRGREGDEDTVRTFEFAREGSGWRATSLGS